MKNYGFTLTRGNYELSGWQITLKCMLSPSQFILGCACPIPYSCYIKNRNEKPPKILFKNSVPVVESRDSWWSWSRGLKAMFSLFTRICNSSSCIWRIRSCWGIAVAEAAKVIVKIHVYPGLEKIFQFKHEQIFVIIFVSLKYLFLLQIFNVRFLTQHFT